VKPMTDAFATNFFFFAVQIVGSDHDDSSAICDFALPCLTTFRDISLRPGAADLLDGVTPLWHPASDHPTQALPGCALGGGTPRSEEWEGRRIG